MLWLGLATGGAIGAVSFLRFDVLALWPAFGVVAVLALLVAVGVFPNEGSLANLATVVLLRVTEGWAFRRYMDMAPLWAAEEKPTKIAA